MKLPLADTAVVRAYAVRLLREYRLPLAVVVTLQALGAVASLALPWMVGVLVDDLAGGTTAERITAIGFLMVLALTLQTLLYGFGDRQSRVFGETVFA